MKLFFHHIREYRLYSLLMQKLVAKIKSERPDFRTNTVFQFDGASPHRDDQTKKFLQNLQLKVVISSPYMVRNLKC